MDEIEDQGRSLDPILVSERDSAADERDRRADLRDDAADERDGVANVGEGHQSIQRGLASLDRKNAAADRANAARDRDAARRDLAFEGIDNLTGAMRRRVGLAAVQREIDRAKRGGDELTLAFVDTVGLKAINDTRGHAAGDQVLEDIAGGIRDDLRSYDLVVRVGGDEFVCTHWGQDVAHVGARYRSLSDQLTAGSNGAEMTVGLAAMRPGDSLGELVERADQAMLADRRHQRLD
jgi:diguanylate cyclase (GGDEF)-like protein